METDDDRLAKPSHPAATRQVTEPGRDPPSPTRASPRQASSQAKSISKRLGRIGLDRRKTPEPETASTRPRPEDGRGQEHDVGISKPQTEQKGGLKASSESLADERRPSHRLTRLIQHHLLQRRFLGRLEARKALLQRCRKRRPLLRS